MNWKSIPVFVGGIVAGAVAYEHVTGRIRRFRKEQEETIEELEEAFAGDPFSEFDTENAVSISIDEPGQPLVTEGSLGDDGDDEESVNEELYGHRDSLDDFIDISKELGSEESIDADRLDTLIKDMQRESEKDVLNAIEEEALTIREISETLNPPLTGRWREYDMEGIRGAISRLMDRGKVEETDDGRYTPS